MEPSETRPKSSSGDQNPSILVFIEMFYLLNCRSLTRSMFQIGVFSNRWLIVGWGIMVALQLVFTYAPFMNHLLGSAPLSPEAWGRVLAAGLISYAIIEIEKWVRRWAAPNQKSHTMGSSQVKPGAI